MARAEAQPHELERDGDATEKGREEQARGEIRVDFAESTCSRQSEQRRGCKELNDCDGGVPCRPAGCEIEAGTSCNTANAESRGGRAEERSQREAEEEGCR